MSFLQEFKTFAVRGNVVDLAVGVIVGAAFSNVINSFVTDVLLPPLGLLIGNIDFSALVIPLSEKTDTHESVSINYGLFLNAVIGLLITALIIFLVVKTINNLRQQPATESPTKNCPECLMSVAVAARRCGHCTSPINHA